mgnify:CR=1 FL=1
MMTKKHDIVKKDDKDDMDYRQLVIKKEEHKLIKDGVKEQKQRILKRR